MANEKDTSSKKSTSTPPASGTARTTERRKERERARSRTQIVTIIVIISAVVGVILLGIVSANRPAETPIPEETASRYEGIPQGRTTDGFPRLGDADAPLKVLLLSAVDCVDCKPFYDSVIDGLLDRVRAGSVALIAAPLYGGLGALTNGQGAARVAVCAADYGQFWQMQDALYNWQQYGNQAFIHSRLINGAGALGLDTTAITACSLGSGPDGVLAEAREQAQALVNFSEPPAVAINGVIIVRNQEVEADGETTTIIIAETDPQAILAAIDSAIANVTRNSQSLADSAAEPEATSSANSQEEAVSSSEGNTTGSAPTESTPEAEATSES